MNTNKKLYRVDRKEIGYIKFIFEAYEGIAVVSTEEKGGNLISVNVPDGFDEDVDLIMADLASKMIIEPVV